MARWIAAGVVATFAVIGFVAVCWVVAGWAERAADWWHARERSVDPPWWWKPWLSNRVEEDAPPATRCPTLCDPDCEADCHEGHQVIYKRAHQPEDCPGVRLMGLPPERTWKQMTSHQLPLVGGLPLTYGEPLEERLVGELERQGWFDADVQARLRAEYEARRMSPAERKDWQRRERNRKRQAKRVEMTYRAHYAAMGYEYPSGLMARVRELTP